MNEEDRQIPEKAAEDKGGDTHPPVPVIRTPASEEEGPKGTEEGENAASLHQILRWNRFKKWLLTASAAEVGMFLLTLVIAGSSIYYTKYARRQWKVMREQLEQMQQTVKIDQRAWIGSIGAKTPDFSLRKPDFIVIITNSGKTPGKIFSSSVEVAPFPKGVFMPIYKAPPEKNLLVVQPGMPGMKISAGGSIERAFTKNEITELRSGTLVYHLYGWFQYTDIFKETHNTRYCYFLETDLKTWDPCDAYNDFD